MLIKMSRYATSTLITLMHDSEKYPVLHLELFIFLNLEGHGRSHPAEPASNNDNICVAFSLSDDCWFTRRVTFTSIAGERAGTHP